MRNLIRPGRDRRVLEAVELALVAERLALPRLADDLERLAEARLALAVGDPVDIVGARDAAAADPELDAAFADVIERRHLLGDPQRMAQRKHRDGGTHAHPPRPGRDRAGDLQRGRDDRAGRVEVDLAEPHAIDTPGLGRLGDREDVPERAHLVHSTPHLLDEDPEVHGSLRSLTASPSPEQYRSLWLLPPARTRRPTPTSIRCSRTTRGGVGTRSSSRARTRALASPSASSRH